MELEIGWPEAKEMSAEDVLFLGPNSMKSSIEVSKNELRLSTTNRGGMVLKLFPIFIPDVVKLFALMWSICTEEMRRPGGQAESNLNKALTNLVYGLYVWLNGWVDNNTNSSMLMFKRPIEMKGEAL